MRSAIALPPATSRYSTVNSSGPSPMSALPFQVPTRDFMRSNSAEPLWGLSAGPAISLPTASSDNNTSVVNILVFMRESICPFGEIDKRIFQRHLSRRNPMKAEGAGKTEELVGVSARAGESGGKHARTPDAS